MQPRNIDNCKITYQNWYKAYRLSSLLRITSYMVQNELIIDCLTATLVGARRYRVSARTGWPVSVYCFRVKLQA